MGMQKFRADVSRIQADGAVVWCARWMGGDSLAKIENCRVESLSGNLRRTVYITGEPDTYFSIPAVCSIQGARVRGYVTNSEDDPSCLVFHHCYY